MHQHPDEPPHCANVHHKQVDFDFKDRAAIAMLLGSCMSDDGENGGACPAHLSEPPGV